MKTTSIFLNESCSININDMLDGSLSPLFVWSCEEPAIIKMNESAKRFFRIMNPDADEKGIFRGIKNWRKIPQENNAYFWFEFLDSENRSQLIQSRNIWVDRDKGIIASFLIRNGAHDANLRKTDYSFFPRLDRLLVELFSTKETFLQRFPEIENFITIETGVSDFSFRPSDIFPINGMIKPLLKWYADHDFSSALESLMKEYEDPRFFARLEKLPEIKGNQNLNVWVFPFGEGKTHFGNFLFEFNEMNTSQAFIRETAGFLEEKFKRFCDYLLLKEEHQKNDAKNQLNEQIIENISEGVIFSDDNLNILFINQVASVMFGFPVNEVIGHHIDDLLVTSEGVKSLIVNKEEGINSSAIRYLHRRSGKIFPCQIRYKSVRLNNAQNCHIFILTDVTESEEGRMRSEQLSQRAFLGDFASMLAHEIRNPMNNTNIWIQNIKNQCDKSSPIYDAVRRIEDDCQRVSLLTTNILSFSKPIPMNLGEVVDLPLLITEALEKWKLNFSRANIVSFFSAPDNFPKLVGDSRTLEQVFNNLIGNSVDALTNQKNGVITIKLSINQTENRPRQIMISLSDNGPGIPNDKIDHIFEPFMTTKKNGNGWGLAVTKRIITSHKGTIQVKSFPGGTVFEIFLPLMDGG